MLNAINFPNLGIEFENVGRAFSIFGLEISYYGIVMCIAILAGMGVIFLMARYTGQHLEDYLDMAIFAIPAAVIGARLLYVLFSWSAYKESVLSVFAIWEGGLAFYGALLGGTIAIYIFAKVRMLWTAELLDTAVFGVLVGQVLGNWGNFLNREAFGEYTDGLFAMQLPVEAVRIADVTDRMRNHLVELEGIRFLQAHPVFLYESIWCLILLIALVIYQYNKEFDGEIFCLYLAGYSIGRFFFEGMRVDSLSIPILGWSVSRIIAVILIVGSIGCIIYNRVGDAGGGKRRMRQKNAKNSLKSSRKMFHGM